mgnify:CR=1 FL=1
MKQLLWSFLAFAFVLQSCSTDEVEKQLKPTGKYDKGFLILNEGGFMKSNASVSFLSQDLSTVENDVFSGINKDKKLGDVAQSIAFYGDLAFIVVNNSNKIEVVNRYTFQSIKTITSGLNNPRYTAFINGKAYVTNWGDSSSETDDFVAVYHISDFSLAGKFNVPFGPEEILVNQNKLYITHSGGFGSNNKVSIIDANSNLITKTLEVGDVPKSISTSWDLIYVLCKGKTEYNDDWSVKSKTAGKLVVINPLNDSVTKTFDFPAAIQPSNGVAVSGFYYYNVGKNVYKMNLSDTALPTSPFINGATQEISSLYGLYASNNNIMITDAKDYVSDGEVFVFATNGSLIKKVSVGMVPSAVYWNE